MASKVHQFIISCLVRKIRDKGYEIIAFEGNWETIGMTKLKIPPCVLRHRPDVIGINTSATNFCIGEGKTQNDLKNVRSKEQFIDFANEKNCELIIGIPKSSEKILLSLLKEINLFERKNVSYVLIPEVLFPNEKV